MKNFMRVSRKLVSVILAVMLIVPMMPLQALATATDVGGGQIITQDIAPVEATDSSTPSVDNNAPPATEETTPPATGEETTPPATGEETTPPATGDETTPPATGEETTPPATGDGTTPPATGDGTTPPATGDGTTPPATGDGTTPPATGDGATPPAIDNTLPPANSAVKPPEEPKPPKDIFTLTIKYIYGDSVPELSGSMAAQDHVETLPKDAEYDVASPTVEHFTPDIASVSGVITGDIDVLVTYNTNAKVDYTVKHIYEGLTEAGTEVVDETLSGAIGSMTNAMAKDKEGFAIASEIIQVKIASEGNTTIEIKYARQEYSLAFNTNGGTYIDTQINKFGAEIDISGIVDPTKPGYLFAGWYSDAGLTTPVAEKKFPMPANDVNFYAKWTESNSNYTAILWLEQADKNTSGTYDYDYSVNKTLTAPVNSTIKAEDAYKALVAGAVAIPDIYEFDATTVGNNETITLSGNGEETINVYLKRKTVTVTFRVQKAGEPTYSIHTCTMQPSEGTHNDDGTHKYTGVGGTTEYGAPCKYIDGKWRKPIKSDPTWETYKVVKGRAGEAFGLNAGENGSRYVWPTTVDGQDVQWLDPEASAINNNRTYHAQMERMPLTDRLCNAETIQKEGKSLYEIFYCLEMLPEDTSTPDRTYEGKRYKFHTNISKFWSDSKMWIGEKQTSGYVIDGFTYAGMLEDFMPKDAVPEKGKNYQAYIYEKRNEGTIAFKSVDGTTNMPTDIKKLFGQKTGMPSSEPIRTGYTFKGWNIDQNGLGTMFVFNAETTMPGQGAVLYAVWEPKVYDVTLDLNHDGLSTVQHVAHNKTVTAPENPTRDGYKFLGWYTAPQTTTQRYVFSNPVTSNFTIYAHWSPITISGVTVKHVDKDTGNVLETETLSGKLVGSTITVESKQINGFVPVAISKSIKVTAGVNEVILEYKPLQSLSYTVIYVEAGNESNALADPVTVTGTLESKVTVNAKAIKGYTPDVYQKTQALVANEKENIIKFVYTKNAPGHYSVEHWIADDNAVGGYKLSTTTPDKTPLAVGETITAQAVSIGSHKLVTNPLPSGVITKLHTKENPLVLKLYYDWNTYEIRYHANNTVNTDKTTIIVPDIRHGSDVWALNGSDFKPVTHQKFLGWAEATNATEIKYLAGAKIANITSDRDLYAVWGDADKYNLTYHANNGSGKTADGGKYYNDETPTAKNPTALEGFTPPTNKKFIGWGYYSDRNDIAYAIGAPISMEQGADVNLYAIWIDKDKNTVTYNGGTIDGKNGTLSDNVTTKWVEGRFEDVAGTVSSNSGQFSISGYKFIDWKDATGKVWKEGESVPVGKDLVLTAQWEKIPQPKATLTYDANGGANPPAPVNDLIVGIKAELTQYGSMTPPEKSVCLGWSETQYERITDKETYDRAIASVVTSVMINTDGNTVYAVWAADENGNQIPDVLEHKVLYNDNNSSNPTDKPVDNNLYRKDDKATVQESILKRTEAVFIGWSIDLVADVIKTQEEENAIIGGGKFYLPNAIYTMGDTDVTFNAVWAEDKNGDGNPDYKQLTVTYLPGASDTTGTTVDNKLYNANDVVTVLKNEFSRTDYIFVGWQQDNQITIAQPNDIFEIAYSVVFTAQWELDKNGPDNKPDGIPDKDEYAVTYDKNGGEGEVPLDSAIYPENHVTTVKFDKIPSKPGHNFLGWDTNPSAEEPTFKQGVTETFDMPKGGVTLYAIYDAKSVLYNVYYVSRRINDKDEVLAKVILEEVDIRANFGQELTLNAKEFPGYTLTSEPTQNVKLGLSDNNYTFYYTPNPATLISRYIDEATNTPIIPEQNWGSNYLFGVQYNFDAAVIPGFTPKENSIKVTVANDIEYVTFLYTRNTYNYEVRYETANGDTLVTPTKGTALFDATITTTPVPVGGYTARNSELSLKITADDTKNIIVFIYDRNSGGGGGDPDPDEPSSSTPTNPPSSTPSVPTTPPTPTTPVTPPTPITPVTPPVVEVVPPEPVTIPDVDAPLAPGTKIPAPTEVIDDGEIPLAAPAKPAWALVNLLLTIFTALISLILFVTYFTGDDDEDEDEKSTENSDEENEMNALAMELMASDNLDQINKDEEKKEEEFKRNGMMRIFSIIPTIVAVVTFILTENMRNPMVLIDKWTLLMAVIALVQILVAYLSRKRHEDEDDDSDKQMPNNDVATQNI